MHLGSMFGVIFWNPVFSIFDNPDNEKSTFLRSEGTPKSITFRLFYGSGFWQLSGYRFLQILVDFGVPWGGHLAPKRSPDRGSEKSAKKGVLSKCGRKSLSPLKGEKGNGRRPGGHQPGGQRTIGNYIR